MQIHIIPKSAKVNVDGYAYFNIDLSWIPDVDGKEIHAVHWNDETKEGEVEFVGPAHPMPITSFGIEGLCTFSKALVQWQEKRDQELYEEEQIKLKEENAKKQLEEELKAQFLTTHLPFDPDEEEDELPTDEVEEETEEDLYYDIEELLREI
jgi:hypothetical protein